MHVMRSKLIWLMEAAILTWGMATVYGLWIVLEDVGP